MEKIKIDKVVIVEGKYDKIKLSNIIDAMIITTEGFGIFKEEEKTALLKRLAKEKGIIVLTDSDGAGLVIRNFFRSSFEKDEVVHLYIPEVAGKEKRKKEPSREGLLGVEGIDDAIIRDLFLPFACERSGNRELLTISRFYKDGYTGKNDSEKRRSELCKKASFPSNLSTKAIIEAFNLLGGLPYYEKITGTDK